MADDSISPGSEPAQLDTAASASLESSGVADLFSPPTTPQAQELARELDQQLAQLGHQDPQLAGELSQEYQQLQQATSGNLPSSPAAEAQFLTKAEAQIAKADPQLAAQMQAEVQQLLADEIQAQELALEQRDPVLIQTIEAQQAQATQQEEQAVLTGQQTQIQQIQDQAAQQVIADIRPLDPGLARNLELQQAMAQAQTGGQQSLAQLEATVRQEEEQLAAQDPSVVLAIEQEQEQAAQAIARDPSQIQEIELSLKQEELQEVQAVDPQLAENIVKLEREQASAPAPGPQPGSTAS